MKVMIKKASDWYYVAVKEFNTLEELANFVSSKEVDHPIIFEKIPSFNNKYIMIKKSYPRISDELAKEIFECDWRIVIYDDYIE